MFGSAIITFLGIDKNDFEINGFCCWSTESSVNFQKLAFSLTECL